MLSKQQMLLGIIGLFALVAGVWLANNTASKSQLKPEGIQGAIYPRGKIINEFSLLDHNNKEFTLDEFKNHWSLIFVGYTHCPDICPTTLALMNEVSQYMAEQKLQAPQIVFLSVDPERDTVDVLKKYVEYFNADFIGLTGQAKSIEQVARNLNAVYQKAPGLGGEITPTDYLMDHSSALLLVNPQGQLQSVLTAPHMPATIIESILKSQAYFELMADS